MSYFSNWDSHTPRRGDNIAGATMCIGWGLMSVLFGVVVEASPPVWIGGAFIALGVIVLISHRRAHRRRLRSPDAADKRG